MTLAIIVISAINLVISPFFGDRFTATAGWVVAVLGWALVFSMETYGVQKP